MSDDIKLGQLLDDSDQRDATHVALHPMTAGMELYPGQRMGFATDSDVAFADTVDKTQHIIGIVDPFLSHPVHKGNRFYCWLFPNTVTGMRHSWEHPLLGESKDKVVDACPTPLAKAWIENFAIDMGFTYDELMGAARYAVQHGTNFVCLPDDFDRYPNEDQVETFWVKFDTVEGTRTNINMGFSCAC